MKIEDVHRFLSALFLFATCFPFLNIFGFESDVQPNTIIVGLFIFLLNFKRLSLGTIDRQLVLFVIFSIFSLALSWNWSLLSLRILIGLFSIPLNIFILQNFVRKKDIFFVVILALHIYFIGGLVEYLGADLGGLVGRNYERVILGGRGFSSFAPEPSFFAITIILFLIYLNKSLTNNRWMSIYILTLGAIQICFMARSGLGILLFAVMLLSRSSFRNVMAIVSVSVLTVVFVISNPEFADARPVQLTRVFINNGFDLVLLDGSINLRVADIVYSHSSVFSSPLGYGTVPWNEYLEQLETGRFLKSEQGRVMSFTGSFVYSFGLISLFFFVYLFRRFSVLINSFKSRRLAWFLLIVIGINAIPISLPIMHMLLTKDDDLL